MPSRIKFNNSLILGCFYITLGLTVPWSPPGLTMDTASELQLTQEALRNLEAQRLQRLREIEAMEEQIEETAQYSLFLRNQERELTQSIQTMRQQEAEQADRLAQLELQLQDLRRELGALFRQQWLQHRHPTTLTPDLRPGQRTLFEQRIQQRAEALLQHQQQTLQHYQEEQAHLAAIRAELDAALKAINDTIAAVQEQEALYLDLLDTVQQQAQEDALELERLARNAATLDRVVQRMQEQRQAPTPPPAAPAPTPTEQPRQPAASPPGQTQPFSQQRGRLPPPVASRVLHAYGSQRGAGLTTAWRGEVYAVGQDAPVQAVWAGQVVYADWMRGYGFLVIIDHGEGYLSLYGNNRELMVRQGVSVTQGQIIARAGGASPVIAPGLYFELRHQGQPFNPRPWRPSS